MPNTINTLFYHINTKTFHLEPIEFENNTIEGGSANLHPKNPHLLIWKNFINHLISIMDSNFNNQTQILLDKDYQEVKDGKNIIVLLCSFI